MKTILVPTDFSKTAQYALDFAYLVAQRNHSKLILLNVVEYPVGATVDPIGVSVIQASNNASFELMMNKAKKKMEVSLSAYNDNSVVIDTIVDIGSPYNTIVEAIDTYKVELVIMGTNGASGLRETLVGSNAEKVVRFAKCPVITIKKDADPSQMKNIVFASDFEKVEENVLMHLKQLQYLMGATIHFVRINTPNNFQRDRVILRFVNDLIKKYMFTDYTINVYNDTYEEDGMVNFAESINADMLALATHGRTGITHLLAGSIAEDVVNHAKRPVWTYHLGQ